MSAPYRTLLIGNVWNSGWPSSMRPGVRWARRGNKRLVWLSFWNKWEPPSADAAGLWIPNADTGLLQCRSFWSPSPTTFGPFEARSRSISFQPGEGIPGGVFSTHNPAWIEKIAVDADVPRKEAAACCGLQSAVAFPVEAAVTTLGIMEFLWSSVKERDEALLVTLHSIGLQIGQLVERLAAERKAVLAQKAGERSAQAKTDFSCHYESRNSYPHEWRDRHDGAITGYGINFGSTGNRRDDTRLR